MFVPVFALVCGTMTGAAISQDAPATEKSVTEPFAKWEKEIRKFEESDATRPPAAGGIVFTGSSSVRLWKLDESFPDLPVVNRGFGGSETSDAVHFAPRIVLPYHPRTVVLYAGDNDIKNKKSAERVADDVKAFCTVVHDHLPETRIVYITTKPSVARWSLIEEQRKANRLVKEFARKTGYVSVVDVEPVMLGRNGEPDPSLYVEDGLHLSPEGYARWTALLKPALQAAAAPRVFGEEKPLSDVRLKPQRTYNDPYHPWTPPKSLAEWEKSAAAIRRQLLVACGLWPMPEKTPLSPVIHGKVEREDFTVERVYFASRPGLYVTGSLYRPRNLTGKVPGVLCPHGHWANGRFYDAGDKGAEEQFRLKAETRDSAAHSPLQARMIHLARMGCVVFHYDMIGYADQKPLDHRQGFDDAEASLRLQNYMGLQTWNSMRALDFLTSLPDVDASRIGVTGASGGGTQTFMLCALDPRPTVAFPAVMVGTAMQGGCVCENSDYLRVGLNNIAITALTAPRPLGMVGADDWTIDIETKGLPELQQVYQLYGQRDLVTAKTYKEFPHNYNEKSRELMYAWFAKHLGLGESAPLTESDFKPLTVEEMTVFTKEHPLPADSLPAVKLREVMTKEADDQLSAWLPKDPSGVEGYREIVAGAVTVMFGDGSEAVEATNILTTGFDESLMLVRGSVSRPATGEVIPAIALRHKQDFHGMAVLWVDGAGKACLFDAAGSPTDVVRRMVHAGLIVSSIDPFLTGESLNAVQSQSNDETLFPVDKQFPGYTFGYNRPLLAQRVRDILATVRAIRSEKDVKRVFLVGTGEAGVWAALANGASPGAVDGVWADLGGFSFDAVADSRHPNMLPGAKRYGGLGALAGLGSGTMGTLYGMAAKDAVVVQQVAEASKGRLKGVEAGFLSNDVLTEILRLAKE